MITVNSSAPECRPRNAKRTMKYKHANTVTERQEMEEDYISIYNDRPYLNITEISAADLDIDPKSLGLNGSPTKVKAIENVVFQAKESKKLSSKDSDIEELMVELIRNHTLG